MALWPFNRRKRGGSRSAEPAVDAPNMGISTRITAQDPKQVRRDAKSTSRTRSRQPSKARAITGDSSEKNSTDGLARNSSQADSTNGRTPLAEVQNPVAALPKPSPLKDVERAGSPTSLQKSATEPITPTLQNKRSRGVQEGTRSKSTKRRAEDKDRLQEIKTMSAPIPVPKRPRSVTQTSSPLAQDNRKIRNGLNRNLERPMSEVSLPLAESLRSSFSGTLEMSGSYRVSPFDALSPRPRILHSDGARHASESFIPSRTSTKKEKGPAIPEEDFHPRARIDNLADEMDASSLRELMERDRRRRERKKRSDRDKLERKLESKAEKQERRAQRKAAAAAAAAAAETTTKDDSGDVQMRDAEEAGPSGRRSPPAKEVASPNSFLGERPQQLPEPKEPLELEEVRQPVVEEESQPVEETPPEVRPITPPTQTSPIELPADVPVELPASDSGTNLAIVTPITTPRQVASSPEQKESPAAKARDARRDADGPSRWKSIFRRSGTKGRGSSEKSRGTPSEFSNTSRESFARQQKEKAAAGAAVAAALPLPPPPPSPPAAVPREPKGRSASNTPRRTKSKFREDLPEFVSPPASHHSGAITPHSPVSPVSPGYGNGANEQSLNKEYFSSRDAETALQANPGLARNDSQRSGTPEAQSAAMLSQSLASVDSEGSWLSGRPPKRSSLPISKREGDDSISEQVGESTVDREHDPTYFARRDPTNGVLQMQQSSGIAAQLARGLQSPDDAESTPTSAQQSPTDGNLRGGQVAGHQPMVVRSDPAHRSRVGLIEMYPSGEDASPSHDAGVTIERTGSPDEEAVSVHEAKSVDYNKGHHSRRVSAGSARILEIPGRDKRHSGLSVGAASATSSRNSPAIPQRTWEEDRIDQALSTDDEGDKRQNAVSVETAGGTTRAPGLGLGMRLGARPVSGQSATSDTSK